MSYAINHGYTSTITLLGDIGRCLVAAGYDLVSVDGKTGSAIPDKAALGSATGLKIVVESNAAVDPCAPNQIWRMVLDANDSGLSIVQATPIQITDIGGVIEYPGKSGSDMVGLSVNGKNDKEARFFTYEQVAADRSEPAAIPLSFMLTVAKHGLALCIWAEGFDSSGKTFSWFVTQRGVDKTGAPWTQKKAPLWTLYSIGGSGDTDIDKPIHETDVAFKTAHFVVREADVNAPTFPIPAGIDYVDSTRLINTHQQLSITEDEKFNLSIPRDLTTQRYFYPLELDLIGYCSADVISQFSEAPVRMYGEATDRVYKALSANGKKNKGMRILFLSKQDEKLIDISNVL